MSVIPVFKPSCSEAEIDAVAEVLRSGWWGLGPKTAEFETAFANIKPTDAVIVGMYQQFGDQVGENATIVRQICAGKPR